MYKKTKIWVIIMILERFYSMKNKSVIIEGQKVTQGTVTDFDGNFSLNVKPGAKLKISYIGFVSQTVVAKNGMQVVLKEEATSLKTVESARSSSVAVSMVARSLLPILRTIW